MVMLCVDVINQGLEAAHAYDRLKNFKEIFEAAADPGACRTGQTRLLGIASSAQGQLFSVSCTGRSNGPVE